MAEMEKFIKSCLLGASLEIAKAKGRGLSITVKGRNDRATSADFASEKYIVGRIRKDYPDAALLSEESYLHSDLEAGSLFVIDPIDGTHNFMQGLPIYGVSIAHYSHGMPTAGGVYLIPQNEMYYAEKGRHSTLNGRRISVSRTAKLEDFFLLCDSRLHLAVEMGLIGGILKLEAMSQHTRLIGAAVYEMAYVASGAVDAQMDFRLKPYDFAASAFIVEQAGGKVTDFEGRKWGLATKEFVSSNGRQHKRIIETLTGKSP